MECLDKGPDMMKEEVRYALKKIKARKATGPDELCLELIDSVGRGWCGTSHKSFEQNLQHRTSA